MKCPYCKTDVILANWADHSLACDKRKAIKGDPLPLSIEDLSAVETFASEFEGQIVEVDEVKPVKKPKKKAAKKTEKKTDKAE